MTARPLPARSRSLVIGLRAAGALILAMTLASCSLLGGDKPDEAPTTAKADPSIVASAPAGLDSFYSQEVVWEPCENGFQCATVSVPLDYANPDGDKIELAALRAPSTGKKQGSLLVNPGGPGGSGYDFVKDAAGTHFSQSVKANYDLVGFDPRGVKRSAPVKCMTDAERDAARAKVYDYGTDAGIAAVLADNKAIAEQCAAQTGPLLGHIDTVSAAKDLDILRAVVNDSKLNYLGYSYGTFLGSTYVSLFPDNVGRMVLDGALDPSISNEELTMGQAVAFEKAIRAYVASCQRGEGCPLTGDVDSGVQQIRDLIAAVQNRAWQAKDGRTVNATMFVSGLITPLYNDQSWPALTQALESALKGDASLMLRLADLGADRGTDGKYTSNSTFAFSAINCLDYPMVSDTAAMRAEEQRLRQASPTLGYFFAYGGTNCVDWPYDSVRTPAPVEYTGDAPIVVIGTTGDPATPVEWSASLRKQLGNASLMTWQGEGHTAYGRANSCLEDAVDSYLVDGKVPADNTVC
ncbi:alpha/beta hydrolase [Pseudarthrobacter sulfonivorans]|uniref:alpha/beta hydrolase n=1 Tax=Pseudarthrobacter sulfonivorans TaxID=121292 RepID=UPI0027846789|nr:alpha/beta hydrolase [Pseudarthrobacter sulfonivorans]MDQ0000218.1 pimeloyl-ACP methyl ester carboxylesterase [Pseudarthrobacter sulfonivorans]